MKNATEENTLTAGRKAMLTGFIGIAISPISLVLGYFLNHFLQSPKLTVEYSNPIMVVTYPEPDPKVLAAIKEDNELVANFRGYLMAFAHKEDALPPTGWLDGEDWDSDYLRPVLQAANAITGRVQMEIKQGEAALNALNKSDKSPDILELPDLPGGWNSYRRAITRSESKAQALAIGNELLKAAKTRKEVLAKLIEELHHVRDAESTRTGEVIVRVGVLNSGDSDGVIFRKADLTFGDSKLPYEATGYTVVKAHSFEEIEFSIRTADAVSSNLNRWAALVKERHQDTFDIKMTAGGKSLAGHGRLPE